LSRKKEEGATKFMIVLQVGMEGREKIYTTAGRKILEGGFFHSLQKKIS